jgi:hypothetical protein
MKAAECIWRLITGETELSAVSIKGSRRLVCQMKWIGHGMSAWRNFWRMTPTQRVSRIGIARRARVAGGRCLTLWLAGTFGVGALNAQLEVISSFETQVVFAGGVHPVPVTFHNTSRSPVDVAGVARLFQTSSSTAAPLSETNWKTFRVLAGQAILESAELAFPSVKAETRFLVQWADGSRKVIGSTEVIAYPTNLLHDLKSLAGESPLGVLDPQDQLKPLLKTTGVEFEDLANREVDSFDGRLAIIGPFASAEQISRGLSERVGKLAEKGGAVVWIQPPQKSSGALKPDFYFVTIGKGTVVVAQAGLCSGLAHNPVAQLNLIHLAQLARHPEPLRLPSFVR